MALPTKEEGGLSVSLPADSSTCHGHRAFIRLSGTHGGPADSRRPFSGSFCEKGGRGSEVCKQEQEAGADKPAQRNGPARHKPKKAFFSSMRPGKPPAKTSPVRRLVLCALLASVGVVLNLLENMVPAFTAVPGAKLGAANVATAVALALFGMPEALCVGLLRCVTAALLSGAPTMAVYGGAGTVLSVLAMKASMQAGRGRLSMAGISMLGAFFYNVGQVAVFAAVVQNIGMFRYLPALTLVSTICGLATGLAAQGVLRRMVPRFGEVPPTKPVPKSRQR